MALRAQRGWVFRRVAGPVAFQAYQEGVAGRGEDVDAVLGGGWDR